MGSGSGSVLAFVVRRLLITVPLLVLISIIVFSLILLIPGDPAITLAGGVHATPIEIARIRRQLHLNEGFWAQYWTWLSHAVRGNLGHSLFENETVSSGIAARFPVTLTLAVGGVVLAMVIGVPAGVMAGVRQGSLQDRTVTIGSSLGVAVPDFWLAMLLVIVLVLDFHLLPAIGYTPFSVSPLGWMQHMLMPWIALGLGGAATIARQVRGALIDTLEQDYVRTAVAKGLPKRTVIGKHALKNALSPAVTVVGIQFGYLLGGTFIIEQIFSLPGIGTYTLQAISDKDLPVIQGVVLVVAVSFVIINLVVDVVYGMLNPKIRL